MNKAQERIEQRLRIYNRDGGICGLCGKSVTFQAMHLDHIVPRAGGGGDEETNLQPSHSTCNVRAYAKGLGKRRMPTLTEPRPTLAFRLDLETFRILVALAKRLGQTKAGVFALAIRGLAKGEGIE